MLARTALSTRSACVFGAGKNSCGSFESRGSGAAGTIPVVTLASPARPRPPSTPPGVPTVIGAGGSIAAGVRVGATSLGDGAADLAGALVVSLPPVTPPRGATVTYVNCSARGGFGGAPPSCEKS